MLRRLQLSCKPHLFSLLACNSKIDCLKEVREKILSVVWNFGLNGWLIDAQGLVVSKMGVRGQFLYILLIYALFGINLGNPV